MIVFHTKKEFAPPASIAASSSTASEAKQDRPREDHPSSRRKAATSLLAMFRRCALALLALTLSSAGARKYACARAETGREITVDCGSELVSDVEFASFGTPTGTCTAATGNADFRRDPKCHSAASISALEDKCLGQSTCMFVVSPELFGGSPTCTGVADSRRWLSVRIACGSVTKEVVITVPAQPPLAVGWLFIGFVFVVLSLYFGMGIAYKVRMPPPRPRVHHDRLQCAASSCARSRIF